MIDTLLTGVLSRKLVRYAYRGARGRAQRGILAPFAMLLHKHGLYVLGKRLSSLADVASLDTGDVINWAVERFTDAEWLRDASFTPPASFQLDEHVDDISGVHVGKGPPERVVIEFSKERAAYARGRLWHRTQELDELGDGRLRLSFTCRNTAPVVSWVLEWGPHAKVIAPTQLASEVVHELRGALEQYETAYAPPNLK